MTATARGIRLLRQPSGRPQAADFGIETYDVQDPGPGEIAIRALYVSVDPYLLLEIHNRRFEDGRMVSRIIARVEKSNAAGFSAGDFVLGFARWQEHDCVAGSTMRRLDPVVELPIYLGAAGHSGFTAMLGVDILDPQPGQTLTVDSAGGVIGSIVCQLAQAAGARVVAIAGGDRAARVAEMYDLAAGVDYKAANFVDRLAVACPNGIDRHFENVGASILDPVMGIINPHGRIALCGAIQHYGSSEPVCFNNFFKYQLSRSTITPYTIYDHDDLYPSALKKLESLIQAGKLRPMQTLHHGFDRLPEAFIAMLAGEGLGKHLVQVAE